MLGSGRHAAGVAEITMLFTTAAPALCIGRGPFEAEYQLPAYHGDMGSSCSASAPM